MSENLKRVEDVCVLLVDDNPQFVTSLKKGLQRRFPESKIFFAYNVQDAKKEFALNKPNVVVLDLCLDEEVGERSGFDLLSDFTSQDFTAKVVILTGHSNEKVGIESLNKGASSFLSKPPSLDHLAAVVREQAFNSRLQRKFASQKNTSSKLTSTNAKMQAVYDEAAEVAEFNQSILIMGETGTGKSHLAKYIHTLSPRSKNEMISFRPSLIRGDLVYSELFGYKKGAFTGANEDRKGLITSANQSTLLIDEIDQVSKDIQVALLEVFQEKKFRALGSDEIISSDFRLISTTNEHQVDLEQMLRRDFYHRIAHVVLEIIPLRERVGDIRKLSSDFIHDFANRSGIKVFEISSGAIDKLMSYNWPGNVRELYAVLESSIYKAQRARTNSVDESHISFRGEARARSFTSDLTLKAQLALYERQIVESAMEEHEGNQAAVCKALGISRTSLYRILNTDRGK